MISHVEKLWVFYVIYSSNCKYITLNKLLPSLYTSHGVVYASYLLYLMKSNIPADSTIVEKDIL